MVVGICRARLALPYNNSLKGKRSVVKSLTERARSRFHVAAAEVADLDVHRRATLGFTAVSNDARHLRSLLDKLEGFIASGTEAQLVSWDITVEHYEDFHGASGAAFALEDWESDGHEED